MISWLAARCDGTDYGHLFEFAFSKDKLFLSLWNQIGSKVILGNLLVNGTP
jgi:uncharacterized membrane protein (UPF0182 family)